MLRTFSSPKCTCISVYFEIDTVEISDAPFINVNEQSASHKDCSCHSSIALADENDINIIIFKLRSRF